MFANRRDDATPVEFIIQRSLLDILRFLTFPHDANGRKYARPHPLIRHCMVEFHAPA